MSLLFEFGWRFIHGLSVVGDFLFQPVTILGQDFALIWLFTGAGLVALLTYKLIMFIVPT